MKLKIKILIILFGMLFSNNLTAQNTPQINNSDDKEIVEMLKTFYKEYITENDKMPLNELKISIIKKKYCTKKLLEKIAKDDLDYDPLVNAQDISQYYLKTMKITKEPKKTNTFQVCFTNEYNKKPFCVKLLIINTKEGFKIDTIY